ncbi:MAG: hypothetical protein JWQ12_799 [Glaciihabitans sp.]|nr:hypothetical protein [Glaciihabitans sp.]
MCKVDCSFLTPFSSDLINVIVAGATIAATFVSVVAIILSIRASAKARVLIAEERERNHDIDTLKDMLEVIDHTIQGSPLAAWRGPGSTLLSIVSAQSRARMPLAALYFSDNPNDWAKLDETVTDHDAPQGPYGNYAVEERIWEAELGGDGQLVRPVFVKQQFSREIAGAIRSRALAKG